MEERKKKGEKVIRHCMYWAMGAGIIPIMVVDLIAVTGVQLDMIRQLANLYNKDSEIRARAFITALSGGIWARIGASFLKSIPVVGQIIGGISMSAMSGATTYAIGKVFVHYMEEEGDVANVDMDEARKRFEKAFEEGKSVANDLNIDKEKDPFRKLEKLAKLKELGIISEEEFEVKKQKFLDEI